MASTTNNDFYNFYNACPDVIIRDKRGEIYSFPSNYYSEGQGGQDRTESNSYSYANSKRWGDFRDGEPWSLTRMLNKSTYEVKPYDGGTVSDIPEDNARDEDGVTKLNNESTSNLLTGYEKKSRGSYTNRNTYGYISANRGVGKNDFIFAVYTKKLPLDFFNDFINLGGSTKTKFIQMISNNVGYGNQRYDPVPNAACNISDIPADVKTKCDTGAAQWCRDDNSRIWGNAQSALASDNKCYPYVQNGQLDNDVISGCSTNLDTLNNPFCKDQRLNSGSSNIKNNLAAKLATPSFCGNDNAINDAKCADVKSTCSLGNNVFDDITAPNYKCNTLIKNLNTTNKIALLANTNLTTLPATIWTTPVKTTLISSFNSSTSTLVSDALCNIATNSPDPVCRTYIQNNFSSLITTNDRSRNPNPILVMYFAGDNFTQPAGMSSHNSLSIPSINKITGIGTKAPTISLGTTWCAKFYVYITPSSTDNYLFKINANDDAKLFLNNTLIIDAWGKGCCKDYVSQANISLNPANGPYLLYVEYRDIGSAANIVASYKTVSASTYSNFALLPEGNAKSGTSPLTGLTASTLYMSAFNPYSLTSSARAAQSVAYCTTTNRFASDTNCLGTAANGYTGMNSLYVKENGPFASTILDYCSDPTANRFATDTAFCTNPNYKSYILNTNFTDDKLKTSIKNYCENSANQVYCKTTDNTNTNNYNNIDSTTKIMNNTYADTLRNARLKYVTDAINTSLNATDNTKGTLPVDVENYIKTDFPNIQAKLGKQLYPNSTIVKPEIYPYCEGISDRIFRKTTTGASIKANSVTFLDPLSDNTGSADYYKNWYVDIKLVGTSLPIDIKNIKITGSTFTTLTSGYAHVISFNESLPGYTTTFVNASPTLTLYSPVSNKLCDTIYTTFNSDPNIIASVQRENDFTLGIQTNAFMGKGLNADDNIKYKRERDSPEKFAVYLPYAINYCATGDNIVSPECKEYYDTVGGTISQGINKQYNTSLATSAFANNESFCNNGCDNEYNDDNHECRSSNMLYIFLLFLFIIVLVMSLGRISNYNKKNMNCPKYPEYTY